MRGKSTATAERVRAFRAAAKTAGDGTPFAALIELLDDLASIDEAYADGIAATCLAGEHSAHAEGLYQSAERYRAAIKEL